MSDITVTVTLTDKEVNSIQKAPLFLEHYGNKELNEDLKSLWQKIARAALSSISQKS